MGVGSQLESSLMLPLLQAEGGNTLYDSQTTFATNYNANDNSSTTTKSSSSISTTRNLADSPPCPTEDYAYSGEVCTSVGQECDYNPYSCPGEEDVIFLLQCTCEVLGDGEETNWLCAAVDIWCESKPNPTPNPENISNGSPAVINPHNLFRGV